MVRKDSGRLAASAGPAAFRDGEYGKPVTHSTRIATTMIGGVMWELIGPLDDESVFARFLAEKGGGVHPIAVGAANYDETVAMEAQRRNELVLSCKFDEIKIAYLATRRPKCEEFDYGLAGTGLKISFAGD
jgi:hypothetical protein